MISNMYSYLHMKLVFLVHVKRICAKRSVLEQSNRITIKIRSDLQSVSCLLLSRPSVCASCTFYRITFPVLRHLLICQMCSRSENTKISSFWKTFVFLKGSKRYQVQISFDKNLTVMTFVKILKQPGFLGQKSFTKRLNCRIRNFYDSRLQQSRKISTFRLEDWCPKSYKKNLNVASFIPRIVLNWHRF